MRILMVNDLPLDRGAGTEIYISRLMDGLRAAGDEVELFAGAGHRGAGRLLDVWDPAARRALGRRAAAFAPDVVHHHHVIRELSVSVLGIPPRVPCALTVHDLRLVGGADRPPGSLVDRAKVVKNVFDRAVARRQVDVTMAVSAEIARRLRARGFPAVEQVPVFAPDPGPAPRSAGSSGDVVFVGRLAPDKGAALLVAAFGRVADQYPDSRLVIVGDGPERQAVGRAAAGLAAGRVEVTGWQDQRGVAAALAGARLVAIPSLPAVRAEGMPLVAVEAAMLGRPLVVSDDPGLVEFVAASGAGVVTRAGSAAELARALDRLLGDAALADRMGAAARALALRSFSPDAGVGEVRRIYRDLLAGERSA